MMSLFAVLLVAVLNLVPAKIQTFTMDVPHDGIVRFDKQTDGSWKGTAASGDQLGTFSVNGSKLIATVGSGVRTNDLSSLFCTNEKTDWKTLSKVSVGDTSYQIGRTANGLDLTAKSGSQTNGPAETIKIRWGGK